MPKLNQVEWDKHAAKHLLSRTILSFTDDDMDFALSMPLEAFLQDYLLKPLPLPSPPADWVDDIPSILNGPHNENYLEELKVWYMKLLEKHNYSFQERMVLFLHNHFTTEARKVFQIQRVYRQAQLLREHAFGNFKTLAERITTDAAMLIYLDGNTNTASSVNENYARELLELFTLGIGNYTQQDIGQAALALTGWTVPNNSLSSAFDPKKHYGGRVSFLGKSGDFNHQDIINIIFEQPESARFFCQKLYLEFVNPKPNAEFIQQLADVFISNNFELRPLLLHLFSSPFFFDESNRYTKIKSPVDFVFSTLHLFGLPIGNYTTVKHFLLRLDQELFNPPDVKGWRGQRKWVNSTTYSIRNTFSKMLIHGHDLMDQPYSPSVDVISFAKRFPSHNNAVAFIDELADYLFHYPLSAERKSYLLDFLTEGNDPIYWSVTSENAEGKLKKLLHTALSLPEFQLH